MKQYKRIYVVMPFCYKRKFKKIIIYMNVEKNVYIYIKKYDLCGFGHMLPNIALCLPNMFVLN